MSMYTITWYGDDDQPEPLSRSFENEADAAVFMDSLPEDSAPKLYPPGEPTN